MELEKNFHNDTINPIHTDLYQITMAYAYFKQNRYKQTAVFELFYRKNPFGGGYVIFAGLNEVLSFLANYKFKQEHVEYLKNFALPRNADPSFYDYLLNLDCTEIKVSSFQEGSIVFANEPLIRVEGPLGLVQMLETGIINLVSFPSLIATNASRFRFLAPDKYLAEFGLRRAQGPDGGLSASQYSYLGGFDSTSNILAGLRYGMPVVGSMAHSYVTSFNSLMDLNEINTIVDNVDIKEKALLYRSKLGYELTNEGELASFIAYSVSFPDKFNCLVDTYNTLYSGVPNFICVASALIEAGHQPSGVRLDSGDLAYLSKESRKLLQEAAEKTGFENLRKCQIIASNDINEQSLIDLNAKKHEIDIFGIGTNLVTCQKQPALGMVYKLVELERIPRIKCSEEKEKTTLPGKKNVFRIFVSSDHYPKCDILTKENESIEDGMVVFCRDLKNLHQKIEVKVKKAVRMNIDVWQGKMLIENKRLKDIKHYVEESKKGFNPSVLNIHNPSKYTILCTEEYFKLFDALYDKVSTRTILE